MTIFSTGATNSEAGNSKGEDQQFLHRTPGSIREQSVIEVAPEAVDKDFRFIAEHCSFAGDLTHALAYLE
jgi:hypothetical protein